jgi:hypothetical protein
MGGSPASSSDSYVDERDTPCVIDRSDQESAAASAGPNVVLSPDLKPAHGLINQISLLSYVLFCIEAI